jgi:hypothetical protein
MVPLVFKPTTVGASEEQTKYLIICQEVVTSIEIVFALFGNAI